MQVSEWHHVVPSQQKRRRRPSGGSAADIGQLPGGPRLRAGLLRPTPMPEPSVLRKLLSRIWLVGRLVRATGSPRPIGLFIASPLPAIWRWLEGRVFFVDQRCNVTVNWRHPASFFVMAALVPLILVFSIGRLIFIGFESVRTRLRAGPEK